mmetsp:Transcript_57333/g.136277  ORF Transcript_57333/g.136277 Transcript_57333/m.136277 type:complete len:628 (-) Transcript_57333:57-1940(-)
MLSCPQSTEDANYNTMMSYNGDTTYAGYVQAYDSSYDNESWGWEGTGQQWNSTYDQSYDQSYDPSYDQTAYGQSYEQQSYDQAYEQVSYDCTSWDGYTTQSVQSAQMVTSMDSGWDASGRKVEASWDASSGPKMGAELLTEMRLAELKRLIDRDAEALKSEDINGHGHKGKPYTGREEVHTLQKTSPLPTSSVNAAPWPVPADQSLQHTRPLSTNSANALPWGPVSADVAPLPKTSPLPTSSVNAAPWPVPAEAAPLPKTSPLPTSSVNAAPWPAPGQDVPSLPTTSPLPSTSINAAPWTSTSVQFSSTSQASADPPALPRPREAATTAPSLGKPYKVLATYEPQTQKYGEMPVTAGDEVFVSEDPQSGWIYAVKRGKSPSGIGASGWVPANALGINAHIPEDLDSSPDASASQARPSFGEHTTSRQGRRGPRMRAKNEMPASQAQSTGSSSKKNDSQNWNSYHEGSSYKNVEDEPWHEHGNWWSKQRHLKDSVKASSMEPRSAEPSEGRRPMSEINRKEPVKYDTWKEPLPRRELEKGGKKGCSKGSFVKGDRDRDRDERWERDDRWDYDYDRIDRTDKGGKGGSYGKSTPLRHPERTPRERPALQQTLDRLNKPLVAPKPASSDR